MDLDSTSILWSGFPRLVIHEYIGESMASSAGWTTPGVVTLNQSMTVQLLMVFSPTPRRNAAPQKVEEGGHRKGEG